jgi:hypothetical protein
MATAPMTFRLDAELKVRGSGSLKVSSRLESSGKSVPCEQSLHFTRSSTLD